MAKYLVTGGAGFIGSNIVEKLVEIGQDVVVLDNLATGRLSNIAPFIKRGITFIEGDVRDYNTCREALKGVDYVLHQAARPSVQRSMEDPFLSHDINVNGGLNLLQAAREANVKRLVAASSSSVYGNRMPAWEPKREEMDMRPLSPYAANKVCMEYYCRVYSSAFALETVSLRYFNVFGPRQDPNSPYAAVIPKFVFALLNKERPVIYGDGEQSRDFTYVENVVAANLAACLTPNVSGMSFNVAGGESHSLLSLLQRLKVLLNRPEIEPVFAEPRKGDVNYSLADLSLARQYLNYQVLINFQQGLAKVVDLATRGIYLAE